MIISFGEVRVRVRVGVDVVFLNATYVITATIGR